MAPDFLTTSSPFTLIYFLVLPTLLTSIPNAQIFIKSHPLPIFTHRVTEKSTHLHFYFQDIVSGNSPTAVQIVGPSTSTTMGFGAMNIADDALTVGQDQGSEVIGRAQGLYAPTSQEEVALLMVMNYVFTKGEHNGSSIAVLGRNPPLQDVREMPIVGGTGLFRFARGYALAHTVWANPQGDATVEYNVYVSHFDQME